MDLFLCGKGCCLSHTGALLRRLQYFTDSDSFDSLSPDAIFTDRSTSVSQVRWVQTNVSHNPSSLVHYLSVNVHNSPLILLLFYQLHVYVDYYRYKNLLAVCICTSVQLILDFKFIHICLLLFSLFILNVFSLWKWYCKMSLCLGFKRIKNYSLTASLSVLFSLKNTTKYLMIISRWISKAWQEHVIFRH